MPRGYLGDANNGGGDPDDADRGPSDQTPAPVNVAAAEYQLDELNKLRRTLGFVRIEGAARALRDAFIQDVDERIASWLRALDRNPDPPGESGAGGPIEGP